MIEISYEPIHIENVITALATVSTAVIAFLIMGVNNFYSNKRLRMELKHLSEEAEKERESRAREESLRNQLISLEKVFSTLQKMRSLAYEYRLQTFNVIFEKVSIKDGLASIDEVLRQLKMEDESMQVLAQVYLVDTPARTDEIIDHILAFTDYSYRSSRLLSEDNFDEILVIFKEEMKPQILDFREYLDELEAQLCEYITNLQ